MRRIATIFLICIHCFFLGFQTLETVESVGVWEDKLIIPTYEVCADNPYPWFNEWKSDAPIYPYPFKDCMSWKKTEKEYITLVLENEYLRVIVLPEIGGHLYRFVDKVNNRDIIYTNHVIKPGYFGVRGGWCSGGFEFNFPKAHSPTTISPIDYAIRSNPDGSASIIVGDLERMYRMKWQVVLTLHPGKCFLEQEVTLHNRTLLPHRYHWWTIVAMHPNDNTQVIFPSARIINHPQEYIITWPIWMGRDNSLYKTLHHRFGSDWSMLEPWDGFFCYYDHGIDAGLVHVANKHVLGGTKYFSYGNTTSGRFHSAYVMSDEDGPYDEIDSGLFLTQADHEIFEPLGVRHWREYWYPVNGTQGLIKATRDAALNGWRDGDQINVALNVNSLLEEGRIIVKTGEVTAIDESFSLSPGKAYQKKVMAPYGRLSVAVTDSQGEDILRFAETPIDESSLPPEGPVLKREKDIEDMSVEEACLAGISALREEKPWEAQKFFKGALRKDPGHSAAHLQLGIIYLNQGLWNEAASELRAALKRNPMQGMPHYYLGVLHKLIGNMGQAVNDFWKAARYTDGYGKAHHCLGQIALAEADFFKAIEHFQNALKVNSRSAETQGFLGAAYRKSGCFEDAQETIKLILQDQPIDHLAAFEAYLLSKKAHENEEETLAAFRKLMRGCVHSYMELSWTYANCGMYQEAIEVLDDIVKRGKDELYPMCYYQLGYLYRRIGDEQRAAVLYRMARSAKDWRYVFPNRLEEMLVLEDVLSHQPDDYGARYALGNLLSSRYRYQHAIKEWEAAAASAEAATKADRQRHGACLTALYRNLAFLHWKKEKKIDKAISYYREAIEYARGHFQCWVELAQLYKEVEGTDEAIAVLESGLRGVTRPAELALALAPLYFERKQYDRIIDMLPKYKNDDWKSLEAQRWVRRARLEKGKASFKAGKFEQALKEFSKATKICRENIPVQNLLVREFAEIHWWAGNTYAKMGKPDEARKCWAEVELEWHEQISPLNFYKAKCLQAIGKHAEAEKLLREMLFFGGMYANRYPHKGEDAKTRIGMYKYLQALAYEGLGMQDEATRLYNEVLQLIPEHEEAKEKLQVEALKK